MGRLALAAKHVQEANAKNLLRCDQARSASGTSESYQCSSKGAVLTSAMPVALTLHVSHDQADLSRTVSVY